MNLNITKMGMICKSLAVFVIAIAGFIQTASSQCKELIYVPVNKNNNLDLTKNLLKNRMVRFTQVEVVAKGDWVISRDLFKGTFKNKATMLHPGGLLMTLVIRVDVEMYQRLEILAPAAPTKSAATKEENDFLFHY